ncbi:hypothetical protein A1O3_08843 [Capronia epimyces CBS 606.96]|uniref:FAR-17a/AIG1-like protein n=1 Tax=Capronia epimyces CBS 606.96 TaxID=1182542 RepID=W9XQW8_9EURO|nr:uncharacterized protein A1O3_08843 [Capronia epimyces CBS 606.96]EXJ79341.1 hypothetical protein A1O3_08843 [Capronia epimyces CBS 606.96]
MATSTTGTTTTSTLDKLVQKHPLQRLASPSHSLSALVHTLGLASFAYSFNYLVENPNPISQAYGWHFQYLTIIGLALASATFMLGLLADLSLSRRLFVGKNILSVCSAPMEVLISILYWGLRLIDPELVVPKELELPFSADASFHLAPSVFLLIDLLLLSPPWTITLVPAVALSTVIAFVYWYWIELCYQANGFYPYPLFAVLEPTQRVLLFGTSALIMAASTAGLKWVYGKVNGLDPRRVGRAGHVN